MFRKLISAIISIFLCCSSLYAQGVLKGTVTHAESNEPLPGTNIFIPELDRGTSADASGQYQIMDIPTGTYTVRATFIGFKSFSQEIQIGSGEVILNINLESSSFNLEQVVVTGYGQVEKRRFTGSISQVSTENIETVPVTSLDQALQGSAPGLQLSASTGTPGAVQQINIRGISSINASTDPLYVIDGVPVVSGELNSGGSHSSLSLLASLSPSNVESISVLKDAVATSLYGARGSNGVIVITTKDGNRGDTKYSFSVQRGVNKRAVDGPEVLNAQQWDELYTESLVNAGVDPSNAQSPWDGVTNTDWKEVTSRDNAISQEYTFSASGGTDRITFFGSVNYQGQEGANIGTNFKRIGGRLNFGYDISNSATLTNIISASSVDHNGLLEGSAFFANPVTANFWMLPIDPAFNDDGTANLNLNNSVYNPVYIAENDIEKKQTYRVLNNTNFDLSLTDRLAFSSKLGIDYIVTEEKYYDNPVHGDGASVNGRTFPYYSRNFNYTWQNSLSYNWQVNQNHEVDLKILQEAQKNKYYTIQTGGQDFATQGLTNASSAGTPTSAFSFANDWGILALMSTASYGFKDKIFVDATYRYEGNSRFAEENRWGGFYSMGGAWLLSDEAFLSGTEGWLDLLKLRVSYGETGNASIGINEYQAFLNYDTAYNGQAGIYPAQLGNENLTWEKATSIDAGLNFGLFDRVTVEGTFFRKNSKDLLFDVPLSYTTGHDEQRQNIGELYNQGLELSLNIEAIKQRDLNLGFGATFTTVKNEVTSLPKDANGNDIILTTGTRYRAVIGYETNAWFMRSWAGVNPENGQPLWYMDETDSEGNVIGRTTTSNYNEATLYYQGASAMPTEYGTISTNINFKGIFLNASLYYSFGNKVYDSWARYQSSNGQFNQIYNQYLSQYEDRWQKPGDQAEVPQVIAGGNMLSNQTSSRFLFDGDYLRLKTLRLGYNIPASLLSNLNVGLSSASVYFIGRNLWTYTYDKDLEYDPEVRQDGFLDLQASPMKTLTFGIKANF